MRRSRLRLAIFSCGSTPTALRASEPRAQAQSAEAACWEAELAGTLDGNVYPLGLYIPRGAIGCQIVRRRCILAGRKGRRWLVGPAALSLNPAIWEAIAATGWRGVNAIESTCGGGVEVAGIMRGDAIG
jgi:hypothetical protein